MGYFLFYLGNHFNGVFTLKFLCEQPISIYQEERMTNTEIVKKQQQRNMILALAPKGTIVDDRYIYMRRVSTQSLYKLQNLGFTVILIGG